MIQTILVPLDGSPLGEHALPTAADLAHRSGARLVLLRAAGENDHAEAEAYLDQLPAEAFGLVAASGAATPLPLSPGMQPPVERLIVTGSPAEAILAGVRDQAADLIVMTTHGRSGVHRLLLGSVAEKVIAASPVPVWLVRADHPALPSALDVPLRLLVPLDGSPFAEAALPIARELAGILHARLTLLHVMEPTSLADDLLLTQPIVPPETTLVDPTEAQGYLGDWVARLRLEGLSADAVVQAGHAKDAILRESETPGVRLIVMATHGRTGLRQTVFGSVAQDTLRRGRLPLVLIRPAVMGET